MANCPKCASHEPDDALFCSQCGERISTGDAGVQQVAASTYEDATPEVTVTLPPAAEGEGVTGSRLARIPKLVWALVACVLVAGVGFAALGTFLQTPKTRFLRAQSHYIATKLNSTPDYLKLQADVQKRMLSEGSLSTYTITADVTGDLPGIDDASRILRTSRLALEHRQDPTSETSGSRAELHVRGSELAAVDFWQSPERFALHVPVLYRDHLVLENRDFTRMADRLGFYYDGPDRYETSNPAVQVLEERESDLQRLFSRYGKEIIARIPDEAFTLEKRAEYDSPDGPVKLDRLTLHLSEEELRSFLTGLISQMREDDEGLDLVAETFAAVFKAQFENAGIAGQDLQGLRELTDANALRRKMREGLVDLERDLDKITFPEGFTWVLWLEGKKIVRQDLELAVSNHMDLDGVVVKFTTAEWANKNETSSAFRIRLEPYGPLGREGLAFETYSITTQPSKQETKTVSSYELIVSERSWTTVSLRLDLETLVEREAEQGKDRVTYNFTTAFGGHELSGVPQIEGQVVSTASNRLVKDHYEQSLLMDLGMSVDGERVAVQLNVDRTVDLKQPTLAFPELDHTNSLTLNDMSEREMQEFMLNLVLSLNQFAARNANLFQ